MNDYWDHDYDFDYEVEYAEDGDHYDDHVDDVAAIEYDAAGYHEEREWVGEEEDDEGDYWPEEYAEDDYGWDDYGPEDYGWEAYADDGARPATGLSPFVFIFLALLFFAGFALLIPLGKRTEVVSRPETFPTSAAPTIESSVGGLPADTFIAPYDDYWVTQGIHGTSYGHMAVDIAAGKGATIRSPIAGRVTEKTTDGVGNTKLLIENEYYQVLMLHGIYAVNVGDEVSWGDRVGEESNIGYTMDMQGRLCTGRDCGYHTHLNVFDKRLGRNVNPLNLLSTAAEQQLVVGSRVEQPVQLP
jgi:murein DD-endopeptidase MepM/ murein hydrolase activator NlpD